MSAAASSSQWRHQYKLISDRHEQRQRQQQQYNNNSNNNNDDTIDRRVGRWVVRSFGRFVSRFDKLKNQQFEVNYKRQRARESGKASAQESKVPCYVHTYSCVCIINIHSCVCVGICVSMSENQHISEFFWKFNKYKNARPVVAVPCTTWNKGISRMSEANY